MSIIMSIKRAQILFIFVYNLLVYSSHMFCISSSSNITNLQWFLSMSHLLTWNIFVETLRLKYKVISSNTQDYFLFYTLYFINLCLPHFPHKCYICIQLQLSSSSLSIRLTFVAHATKASNQSLPSCSNSIFHIHYNILRKQTVFFFISTLLLPPLLRVLYMFYPPNLPLFIFMVAYSSSLQDASL